MSFKWPDWEKEKIITNGMYGRNYYEKASAETERQLDRWRSNLSEDWWHLGQGRSSSNRKKWINLGGATNSRLVPCLCEY